MSKPFILLIACCTFALTACITKPPAKAPYAQFTVPPVIEAPKSIRARKKHQQKVLNDIRAHIDANQLTLPRGNNALHKIREFERLYPNESSTFALRNEITDIYLSKALKSINKSKVTPRDIQRSNSFIERAKKIDPQLRKMDKIITMLQAASQTPSPVSPQKRKVVRTPLNPEAVAARTSIVRNVAKKVAKEALKTGGSIVVYAATEEDATWILGVIRSFFIGVDESRIPPLSIDKSKSWKPTIDIIYPN